MSIQNGSLLTGWTVSNAPRITSRARARGSVRLCASRIPSHSARKERANLQRRRTRHLLTACLVLIVSLFAGEIAHGQSVLTLHSAIQQAERSALAHQGQ